MTMEEAFKEAGFDLSRPGSRVIAVEFKEDEKYPGFRGEEAYKVVREISKDKDALEAFLNKEFSDGFGGPEMPRFVAEDLDKIYFPVQYDGSTWIDFVYKDIGRYLRTWMEKKEGKPTRLLREATPYPGGS